MLFKASFDVYYFTINVPFINNGCYISVTNQCRALVIQYTHCAVKVSLRFITLPSS